MRSGDDAGGTTAGKSHFKTPDFLAIELMKAQLKKPEKREQNEKKFGNWEELAHGGRRYWYDVEGRAGWKARYVKEVDEDEDTIEFYQKIHDAKGRIVELHEKYPVDRGHRKVEKGRKEGG